MLKKLGILLEALTILSLIGVGFASWEITQDKTISKTENGGLLVDQVFDVSDVGISYIANSAKGFTYYQEIDPTTNETSNYFDRTTLSFSIYLNRTVLQKFEYDMPEIYYLEVKLYYISSSVDLFTNNTLITAPSSLKCSLQNIENLFVTAPIQVSKTNYGTNQYLYSLTANVPLKVSDAPCLYNLALSDNKPTSGSIPIDIAFEFTNPTTLLTSNYFDEVCNISYNYSLSVNSK